MYQPVHASQQETAWWTKSNFLGYSPKVVMTNEIARSLIIMQHFPYNSKIL